MTSPTTRISAALTAGSARTSGPSSESRPNVRRASTATSPIAVIVAARPMLNATMSASPRPIRWSAIAERRTTSAEGQGRSPAAMPTPRIPFEVSASSWSCVVLVRPPWSWSWSWWWWCDVRASAGAAEDGCADGDDEHARDEREPRVQLLGNDERGKPERHEAEREDAGRVRDRDGAAEEEGVARPSLRPDEVGGDHRLAVSRRQRVRRTPERRDQEREEERAERELAALDERLEAASHVHGCGRVADRRGRSRLPTRGRRSPCAEVTSSGERRRSAGYGVQPVARTPLPGRPRRRSGRRRALRASPPASRSGPGTSGPRTRASSRRPLRGRRRRAEACSARRRPGRVRDPWSTTCSGTRRPSRVSTSFSCEPSGIAGLAELRRRAGRSESPRRRAHSARRRRGRRPRSPRSG